jgi:hypothetical protein
MVFAGIIIVVLVALSVAYLLGPLGTSNNNTPTPAPTGLQELANHYMTVMHSLNGNETKTAVATQLNGHYNQTELFGWEHTKMVFNQSTAGYFENPIQILSDGKGVCFQWSIVYAAACLSESYPCRLVAAVDTTSWSAIHMWTEVYYNGTWVHVDPSDSVWDNPQRYHDPSWGWGQFIGSQVRIYAFQEYNYQDVTVAYTVH